MVLHRPQPAIRHLRFGITREIAHLAGRNQQWLDHCERRAQYDARNALCCQLLEKSRHLSLLTTYCMLVPFWQVDGDRLPEELCYQVLEFLIPQNNKCRLRKGIAEKLDIRLTSSMSSLLTRIRVREARAILIARKVLRREDAYLERHLQFMKRAYERASEKYKTAKSAWAIVCRTIPKGLYQRLQHVERHASSR